MNLNFLCTPGKPGISRWRYLNISCPIYCNRLHRKIRFNECFTKFGFAAGKKIILLEHFSDPIGKFLFSLALDDELQFAYPLWWNGNGKETGISCTDFFKTIQVPELDKTRNITRKRGVGESGFYIDVTPIEYNYRIYFEADFNKARSIASKKSPSNEG